MQLVGIFAWFIFFAWCPYKNRTQKCR